MSLQPSRISNKKSCDVAVPSPREPKIRSQNTVTGKLGNIIILFIAKKKTIDLICPTTQHLGY